MKNLTRLLLHALAVLSLLCSAAITALWLASHHSRVESHPAFGHHH